MTWPAGTGDCGSVALAVSDGSASASGQRGTPGLSGPWRAIRSRCSWLVVLIAAALTLLVLEFVQPLAYHLPTLRATVETVMTVLALIAAYLLKVQFTHSRRLRDLLAFAAVTLLALLEFVTAALPAAFEVRSGTAYALPIPFGQLAVAAIFVAAAFTSPHRLVTNIRRPLLATAGASVLGVAVAALFGLLLRGLLLIGGALHDSGIRHALGRPFGLAVLVVTAAAFAGAARGFQLRGRRDRDDTITLFAGAAILLAVGRLYYLALPWVAPDSVASRQIIALLAFILIFVAAARRELALRSRLARAAAIAERRRVARDLHDGLAQDLAFIAAHGSQIADRLGDEHPLAIAARRALAVSRGTISDLSAPHASSSGEALEAVAHELSHRFEIAVAVNALVDVEPAPDTREHVARIAREAIANAARHGGAQRVTVSLRSSDLGVALRIRDDGSGIDDGGSAAPREGFGLRSMRERAVSLGGEMTVRPGRRGGTELEVVLP